MGFLAICSQAAADRLTRRQPPETYVLTPPQQVDVSVEGQAGHGPAGTQLHCPHQLRAACKHCCRWSLPPQRQREGERGKEGERGRGGREGGGVGKGGEPKRDRYNSIFHREQMPPFLHQTSQQLSQRHTFEIIKYDIC